MMSKFLVMSLFLCGVSMMDARSHSLPRGFVYVRDVDPTIVQSMRYATEVNFVGSVIDGYKEPVAILTKKSAYALKDVQQELAKKGFSLVIYDAYRPQRAVDHFVRWGKDIVDDRMRSLFYPDISKDQVFEQGYVATKSGHSRGSTVDVTIIPLGTLPHELKLSQRPLTDGRSIPFLDDGTIDMGSSFDLFDDASHGETSLVGPAHQANRQLLKDVMVRHGFRPLKSEWWHFTLLDEPFPETYFDFVVE